jgi:predicted alpha/beta-hydrolase family hydrolase
MSRLVRTVTLLVAAGLLTTAVGCAEEPPAPPAPSLSSVSPTSPGPTLPPVGAECPQDAAQGRTLRLTNGAGHSVAAIELGEGSSGVVLAHQSDGSLCEWLPYGAVLAKQGFRVLAFDFVGSGSSSMPKQKTYVEDVRTAVAYLREQGAARVVIMGASMGATMSVVAAAAIAPPVDGVIALSSPLSFDGVNAERAAPSLRSPVLYIAGDTDGDFATYAKAINDATPTNLRTLSVVTAPQHGIRLLDAETQATFKVRSEVLQFLYLHDPPEQ